MDLSKIYDYDQEHFAIARTIIAEPIYFFMLSNVLLVTVYIHLLKKLLAYQRITTATQIAVLMDVHFKKEHRIVRVYKVFFYTVVCLFSLLMIVYPAFMLLNPSAYIKSPVTRTFTYLRFLRIAMITVLFLRSCF